MTVSGGTDGSLAERSLGEIAATLPGATVVFRRHKLDFCCGGDISLAIAATRKGLDVSAIVGELSALSADNTALPAATNDLIDRILERYHAVHRRELEELRHLAQKVERVHAGRPDVPVGLYALLEDIADELDAHMEKEEMVLFPSMRAGGHPMLAGPVTVMRHEHLDHGQHLAALERIAHDFEAPADACGTWRALYVGLRKFADDLMEHIHLENNVLFPRFEA